MQQQQQHTQHICPLKECSKLFKCNKSLTEHMRIHNGQKPYRCHFEGCDKRFTQYSTMQKHERMHTGAKPYNCNQCIKTFTQVSNLKRHERLHAGEKPHACEVCNKRFSTLSNLKQHVVTHENKDERVKLSCDICGKSYMYHSGLHKHMVEHEKTASQTSVKKEYDSTDFDVKEESHVDNEPKPSKKIFISPDHVMKANATASKVEYIPKKEEEEEAKQKIDKRSVKVMLVIQCNLDSLIKTSMLSKSSGHESKSNMISLESLLYNSRINVLIKDKRSRGPSENAEFSTPNV